MKKVLLIALSVLLVISLPSCKPDKSEEAVSTFEEFANATTICTYVYQMAFDYLKSTTVDVDFSQDTKQSYKNMLEWCILELESSNDEELQDVDIESVDSASGTLSGTYDAFEFKNVEIKTTYTKQYEGKSGIGPFSNTFTLSGTFTATETPADDGGKAWMEYSYNFVINGKTYNLSYSARNTAENSIALEYKAASINGKEVNLRFLNSSKIGEW